MSIPVLSELGLINWLEKKDPKETYDYSSHCSCLGAQYLHAHGLGYGPKDGHEIPSVFGPSFDRTNFRHRLEKIAVVEPCTYGGALARARMKL